MSMADEAQEKEYQFPTTVHQAYTQLAVCKKEYAKLELRIKGIEKLLIAKMPVALDADGKGTVTTDGVTHIQWMAGNPAYTAVIKQLKDEGVIPKTRHERVGVVVSENTKQTPRHKFKEAEEQ